MQPAPARFLLACLVALAVLVAPLRAQPASRDTRPLGPAARQADADAAPSISTGGAGAFRTAASLAFVLAVIFVGAKVFRKVAARSPSLASSLGVAGRSPAGILEVLGRYPLSRGSSLVLLRIDRRILLLSQTAPGASRGLLRGSGGAALGTLCEITSPDEVASILAKAREEDSDSISAKFESLLQAADLPHAPEPASPTPAEPEVVVRAGAWTAARGAHA